MYSEWRRAGRMSSAAYFRAGRPPSPSRGASVGLGAQPNEHPSSGGRNRNFIANGRQHPKALSLQTRNGQNNILNLAMGSRCAPVAMVVSAHGAICVKWFEKIILNVQKPIKKKKRSFFRIHLNRQLDCQKIARLRTTA